MFKAYGFFGGFQGCATRGILFVDVILEYALPISASLILRTISSSLPPPPSPGFRSCRIKPSTPSSARSMFNSRNLHISGGNFTEQNINYGSAASQGVSLVQFASPCADAWPICGQLDSIF